MEDIISNIVAGQAKTTMLDSIVNTDDIDFLKKEFTKTLKEKWQLETNWNELKKWLEEESTKTIYQVGHLTSIIMTLDKMQELEGKDD